jgi:hypothetical protein
MAPHNRSSRHRRNRIAHLSLGFPASLQAPSRVIAPELDQARNRTGVRDCYAVARDLAQDITSSTGASAFTEPHNWSAAADMSCQR